MKRRSGGVRVARMAGFILMSFSSGALAGFTSVIPNHFGQPGPDEIIAHVYPSTITATRLPDNGNDTALTGQRFVATAVARFSDYTQSYGVMRGGSFIDVLDVSGKNYHVTGTGKLKVNSGESFARTGNSGTDSSTPSANADGRDHVVTYRITGANPDPQYLQFWEDLNDSPALSKGRTKSDFNDLVVQLEPSVGSVGESVPLPPALLSGASFGVTMLVFGRVRRRPFLAHARARVYH